VAKVSKREILGKRRKNVQPALRMQMWAQGKEGIKAHLSESCLRGLVTSAPKNVPKPR
jgi:hypothetical protein